MIHATLDTLYHTYHARLARRIDYLVNDRCLTEDLLQETFLRAWQKMQENPQGTYTFGWLYLIASHLALDEIRKRRRKVTMQSLDASMEHDFDIPVKQDFFCESDLPRAFSLLSVQDREVCELFVRGYDGREIALMHGKGKDWGYCVRNRLKRILARLEANEEVTV